MVKVLETLQMEEKDISDVLDSMASHSYYGEFFAECCKKYSVVLKNGEITTISTYEDCGFSLRALDGSKCYFSCSNKIGSDELLSCSSRLTPHGVTIPRDVSATQPYRECKEQQLFDQHVNFLTKIYKYSLTYKSDIESVSMKIAFSNRDTHVITQSKSIEQNIPLCIFSISITIKNKDKREEASQSVSFYSFEEMQADDSAWQKIVQEVYRKAYLKIDALNAPQGEMDVVLAQGAPSVLFHEAVGHGLEGDFNRKDISTYSGKIGQEVAPAHVTVIDDGSIDQGSGSLLYDDEGTQTEKNVLIRNGILVKYMQDVMHAHLMNDCATGNGRRESYRSIPLPRMTNTYLNRGNQDPASIIESLDEGIYAVDFGGGQVDITSGQFVFECTEAYLVQKGKIGAAVKGATLIGHGPTVIQNITKIGNDLSFDKRPGICIKNGQCVPVGCGQPTIYVKNLTIGGMK